MIYDISMTISEAVQVYKNKDNKKPHFHNAANFLDNHVFETALSMNLHTGTHIDFPLHIIEDGLTSDSLELKRLIGEAIVIDVTHVKDAILISDIQTADIRENDYVLLKTKNSLSDDFLFDYAYLSDAAALFLVQKNVQGVGIDGLGIERAQEGHPTHVALLSKNKFIIEGLRLKAIQPGRYDFICLPIKLAHVEALPARAILIDQKK